MKKETITVLLAIVSFAMSCTHGAAEKNAPVSSNLVGTWRLIEYTDFDTTSGKVIHPYGEHPKGYFTYTKSGIVNLNISAEKPIIVSADSEYIKQFSVGVLLDNACGYFGTYTIDDKKSVVTHHVKGGSVLSYIGTDQPRRFILKGDTLLIGDPEFKIGKRVLIREE
ncbi:MAG: lipocalin-like domain-containing protein [Ferruginibacter sp.]